VNYINPPYSLSKPFALKCVIELLRGNSSILLIPKLSITSNSSLEYAAKFADVITTGSLEFCGKKRKLPCDLVMACFFTPELKRFLAHNRMLNFK
jgi:hypothetical protein